MSRTRKLSVAFALALGGLSPFAIQPAHAAPPVILSSFVAGTQMTITGTNLSPGVASVLLGPYGPLTVAAQTATRLIVNLPAGIPAGSYALSVRIGAKANVDESVVTIVPSGATSGGLNVILRDYSRTLVLAPGDIQGVTSVCLPGEIAVSGGPSGIPPPPVFIFYSTLIWDGVGSGWDVEYLNSGTTNVTVTPRTTVSCVPGTITKP